MLTSGDEIDASIEKPAAGGRMIARHDGQIVLVAGAIPGERVSVRIDGLKRLAFGSAVRIPRLRPTGGMPDPIRSAADAVRHIAYSRRCAQAEIVTVHSPESPHADPESVPVAASPDPVPEACPASCTQGCGGVLSRKHPRDV